MSESTPPSPPSDKLCSSLREVLASCSLDPSSLPPSVRSRLQSALLDVVSVHCGPAVLLAAQSSGGEPGPKVLSSLLSSPDFKAAVSSLKAGLLVSQSPPPASSLPVVAVVPRFSSLFDQLDARHAIGGDDVSDYVSIQDLVSKHLSGLHTPKETLEMLSKVSGDDLACSEHWPDVLSIIRLGLSSSSSSSSSPSPAAYTKLCGSLFADLSPMQRCDVAQLLASLTLSHFETTLYVCEPGSSFRLPVVVNDDDDDDGMPNDSSSSSSSSSSVADEHKAATLPVAVLLSSLSLAVGQLTLLHRFLSSASLCESLFQVPDHAVVRLLLTVFTLLRIVPNRSPSSVTSSLSLTAPLLLPVHFFAALDPTSMWLSYLSTKVCPVQLAHVISRAGLLSDLQLVAAHAAPSAGGTKQILALQREWCYCGAVSPSSSSPSSPSPSSPSSPPPSVVDVSSSSRFLPSSIPSLSMLSFTRSLYLFSLSSLSVLISVCGPFLSLRMPPGGCPPLIEPPLLRGADNHKLRARKVKEYNGKYWAVLSWPPSAGATRGVGAAAARPKAGEEGETTEVVGVDLLDDGINLSDVEGSDSDGGGLRGQVRQVGHAKEFRDLLMAISSRGGEGEYVAKLQTLICEMLEPN